VCVGRESISEIDYFNSPHNSNDWHCNMLPPLPAQMRAVYGLPPDNNSATASLSPLTSGPHPPLDTSLDGRSQASTGRSSGYTTDSTTRASRPRSPPPPLSPPVPPAYTYPMQLAPTGQYQHYQVWIRPILMQSITM
jgi:hypothetical protein